VTRRPERPSERARALREKTRHLEQDELHVIRRLDAERVHERGPIDGAPRPERRLEQLARALSIGTDTASAT
jgi:hypothetical protein